jgi:DNA-binding response OmpR family regulator
MTTKRVLIVEDDRAIARLLRDNLEYEGFAVDWAANGQEALEKAQQHPPDLVLLDLMLPPGIDAYDLCRSFSDVQGKAVIIISARARRKSGCAACASGPTTTSSSRLPWTNCWRASRRCCAAPHRGPIR